MSKRWKMQIIFGTVWTLVVTATLAIMDLQQQTFSEQLSSPGFWVRFVLTLIIGIFGLGYYQWKQKVKREQAAVSSEQSPRP